MSPPLFNEIKLFLIFPQNQVRQLGGLTTPTRPTHLYTLLTGELILETRVRSRSGREFFLAMTLLLTIQMCLVNKQGQQRNKQGKRH